MLFLVLFDHIYKSWLYIDQTVQISSNNPRLLPLLAELNSPSPLNARPLPLKTSFQYSPQHPSATSVKHPLCPRLLFLWVFKRFRQNLPLLKPLSLLYFTLFTSNMDPCTQKMLCYGPIVQLIVLPTDNSLGGIYSKTLIFFHVEIKSSTYAVFKLYLLLTSSIHIYYFIDYLHNHLTGFIFLLVALHIIAIAVVEIFSIYFGCVIFRKQIRNRPSDEEVN